MPSQQKFFRITTKLVETDGKLSHSTEDIVHFITLESIQRLTYRASITTVALYLKDGSCLVTTTEEAQPLIDYMTYNSVHVPWKPPTKSSKKLAIPPNQTHSSCDCGQRVCPECG